MLQVLTPHTSKLPKKVLKNTKNMTPNSCSVRPEKFHPYANQLMILEPKYLCMNSMTRFMWIWLVLLCLAVSQSDGRGGRGGRRGGGGGGWINWSIYFTVLGIVTFGVLLIACTKAKENYDGSTVFGIPQDPLVWVGTAWLCFAPPLGILVWVCLLTCWEQEQGNSTNHFFTFPQM